MQDNTANPQSSLKKAMDLNSSAGMLDEIKNEPVWSSYLDPEDETTVLFYNRITKESVKEQPADYDGFYVIGENAASNGAKDDVAKKIY